MSFHVKGQTSLCNEIFSIIFSQKNCHTADSMLYIVFKKLFSLKYESITVTARMVLYNCNSVDVIRRKSVYNLINRINISTNSLVNIIYNSLHFTSSHLYSEWKQMLY